MGRRRQGEINARRVEIITEILTPFSTEERQRLVGLLERFIVSADNYVAGQGHAEVG
jgi:hypothetical protein